MKFEKWLDGRGKSGSFRYSIGVAMFGFFRRALNTDHEEAVLLAALATVPQGCVQRHDGLRCETKVIDFSDRQFQIGLKRLVSKRLVEKTTMPDWPYHLPRYCLLPMGRDLVHGPALPCNSPILRY